MIKKIMRLKNKISNALSEWHQNRVKKELEKQAAQERHRYYHHDFFFGSGK